MKNKKKIFLKKDEQATLVLKKSNYDFAAKNWGFYVTPSFQKRCKNNSLKPVIVYNKKKEYFLYLVMDNHKDKFISFLKKKKLLIRKWINTSKYFRDFF